VISEKDVEKTLISLDEILSDIEEKNSTNNS